MFARLWWKEARQTWPVWAFLVLVGLAVQGIACWYTQDGQRPQGLAFIAGVILMIYAFLIAAAVFAGERENGTLWILDALPVDRLRLWAAKASFAFVTALGLGVLLLINSLVFEGYSLYWREISGDVFLSGLVAMGWGLFWSSLLANALTSAVLAMVSLCVTLLTLVNLQTEARTVESAPVLLLVTALTTAASAWIFRRFGPPRWEPRRARPTAAALAEGLASNVLLDTPASTGRLARVWTHSVPRLLWETLRQVGSGLWMLIVLAIASSVVPFLLSPGRSPELFWLTILGSAVLALMTGVLAFNGENRGRTQRFLLQHGARPGVVWAVKVGTWWLLMVGLCAIAFTPFWSTMPTQAISRGLPPFLTVASIVFWGLAGLTIAFALGVVCGMTFRRGIMAGMIALVLSLALAVLLGSMLAAQVLFPWHWPYLAAALVAVGWAWSGDWMYELPGWKRWGRLAAYAAAAPAILAPAYIASRVWTVPELPASLYEQIFQRSRITAPVPDADNAAPLYIEASRLLNYKARDRISLDVVSFDPPPIEVVEWVRRIEPALAMLREAARKPACRYRDMLKSTTTDSTGEPPLYELPNALAVSARVRLAKGDLEGAWTEVETLERMARHYPDASGWQGRIIDPQAASLVLRWAIDPRQTAATLEKAAEAWKALPPATSIADRIRVDAALFHNLLDLPNDDLEDRLLYEPEDNRRRGARVSRAKDDSLVKLKYDVQTTSWERARTRRVYSLLAAAQIRRFENDPNAFGVIGGGFPVDRWRWMNPGVDPYRSFGFEDDGGWSRTFTPDDLNMLYLTTPLLAYSDLGRNFDSMALNIMTRRAVWVVLLLRLHQARHDGKLPETLDAIRAPADSDELGASPEELIDVYSGNRLGYIRSRGQILLPIDTVNPVSMTYSNSASNRADPREKPTPGDMLLYSVGADGINDMAEHSLRHDGRGDLVFPLKDGVKPPTSEAH